MSQTNDPHEPSAAFVAALEQEIMRELRPAAPARSSEEAPSGAMRRPIGRRERIAAMILLVIGLSVGAGGQLAYAQAQSAQQRNALEREKRGDRDILLMRLRIAREERDRTLAALQAGSANSESALAAETEVKLREFAVMRAELELAEIQATSVAPRDELWAPKIGDRDFVRERLRLQLAAAQELLKLSEARSAARVASATSGSATWGAMSETARDRVRAEREFQLVANQMLTREQFINERISVEQVSRQSRADRLGADYRAERALHELAEKQLAAAKQRFALGAATALEVKRAELEVLEREAEIDRLRIQMRTLDRPE